MFKNLFKRNQDSNVPFIQPLEGNLLSIEEVPDPVFSQKMMGDGIAIDPTNGTLISPVNGEVVSVFPSKHAISLKAEDGREILIHIGLDTVTLKGDGFTSFVKDGQKVKQGQKLMEIDFEYIKTKVPSIITPVVFTNLADGEKVIIDGGSIKIV